MFTDSDRDREARKTLTRQWQYIGSLMRWSSKLQKEVQDDYYCYLPEQIIFRLSYSARNHEYDERGYVTTEMLLEGVFYYEILDGVPNRCYRLPTGTKTDSVIQISNYGGQSYELGYRENNDGIIEVFHGKIPPSASFQEQIDEWNFNNRKWRIEYEYPC